MALIRTFAVLTFVLMVAYYVLRVLATQCSGSQCDVYIGPSLLLPLLTLTGALVTGLVALAGAAARRQGSWLGVLAVATAVSVLGPLVSLAVFRDRPDAFVPVATVLVLLAPLFALIYSFRAPASS